MRISTSQSRSAGFSLLELLLVVGVGAVLILAGLGAYRLVSEGANTNRAVSQLTSLKQAVQQAYAGQGGYGAASLVAQLNTMRALPSDMPVTGANIRNAFGLNTTVVGNGAQFSITFPNVPVSACIKMGQLYTPANASDLVSLTVRGAAVAAANFTLAGMTTACGATPATMVWTFQ